MNLIQLGGKHFRELLFVDPRPSCRSRGASLWKIVFRFDPSIRTRIKNLELAFQEVVVEVEWAPFVVQVGLETDEQAGKIRKEASVR